MVLAGSLGSRCDPVASASSVAATATSPTSSASVDAVVTWAAASDAELRNWLHILLHAACGADEQASGMARSCWMELHDLLGDLEEGATKDSRDTTAAVVHDGTAIPRRAGGQLQAPHEPRPSAPRLLSRAALDAALSPFRPALLEGVLRSGGRLPYGFASLSAAERDAIDDVREECRALLRGAVFVDAAVVDGALEALRIEAERAISTSSTPTAASASSHSDVAEGIVQLEAVLHATSAAAKSIGRRDCAPLSALICAAFPAVSSLASTLMASGDGYGRGLLTTQLILVGAFAQWLGEPTRALEMTYVLPTILASLSVPEEEL